MATTWDEQTDKLVNGYIHGMEMEYGREEVSVPDGIITICLLYFFQSLWEENLSGSNAEIDGNFISNIEAQKWFTAYSKATFNSGIHECKIKINNVNDDSLFFGIDSSTKTKEDYFITGISDKKLKHYNYGFGKDWGCNRGKARSCGYEDKRFLGFAWEKDDIICMKLDLNTQKLQIDINDQTKVIMDGIYNDFDDNNEIKYRFCVCHWSQETNTRLQFFSYKCIC